MSSSCKGCGSPPDEPSSETGTTTSARRDFLKLGLFSLCSAAGTAAASSLLRPSAASAATPAPTDAQAPPATVTAGELSYCSPSGRMPTLSTDGRLLDPLTGKPVERDPNYHSAAGHDEVRRGIPNRKWVMVIDQAECDGCERCSVTCAKHHEIPAERQWMRIYKMQAVPGQTAHWFPKPCFHCDDPPCTRVCPVDATFKRQDGIVLIDNERCIGCRFCMAACPYSTRVFNWDRPPETTKAGDYTPEKSVPRRMGTVEKCDFCPEMLREGKLPHCVSACRKGALMFGDKNEDAVSDGKGRTHRLSLLLQDKSAYRYLEELGTQPSVYYLPPKGNRYDPPKLDDEAGGEP